MDITMQQILMVATFWSLSWIVALTIGRFLISKLNRRDNP